MTDQSDGRFRSGLLSDASATNGAEVEPLPDIEIVRNEGRISTLDGNTLHWWSLTPKKKDDDPILANLVYTHGYDDYTERYTHFIQYFAERGVGVYALDLRGHGKSSGPRSTIYDYDEYVGDLQLFVSFVKEKAGPEKPLFLSAHSNGALALAKMLISVPEAQMGVAGVLLLSPYMARALEVSIFTEVGARVAGALMPSLLITNPARNSADLSTDPEVKAGVIGPETSSGMVSVRWVTESEKAQKYVMAHASDIVCPICVAIGGADPIASPNAGRQLFAAISSKDKTLLDYPGLRHELQNEIGKEKIMAKLCRWIQHRAEINMSLVTPERRPKKQRRQRMISAGEEASHEYKEAIIEGLVAE